MSVAQAFKNVSDARPAPLIESDAKIPWESVATPVVAQGFDRILSPATVRKFRSDFLTLVGNIRRLKTYQDVLRWQEAVTQWREALDQYIERAIRELKRFRTTEIPVNLAELWEHDLQRAVSKIRTPLYSMPMERYEFADRYTYRPHERGEVEQQLFRDFQKEAPAWDRRVRRKAQEAWRDLDTVLKSMQDSLSRRDLALVVSQDETIKINGFHVTLRGFGDRAVFSAQTVVEKLRDGLRLYEQRAKAVYPWLLRYRVPLVVNNSFDIDKGGSYSPSSKTIELVPAAFAADRESPRALVHILAHEMGHHIYRVVLSAKDHEFWSLAVKGDRGPFDLREVAQKSKSSYWVLDEDLARRDPVFALRGQGVMHDPRYKDDGLETQDGIAAYLARGNDPIITLTTQPITGYAAKNPEEAFCEALGMVVAYGPRAVLPIVRERLSMLLPQLRVTARTVTAAPNTHPFIRLAEVVRQHAANVAKTGAKIDALVAGWAKTGEPNVRQLKLWLTKLQKAYEKGLVNPPANARPYETEFVKTTVHQAYNVEDLQGEAAYVVKVVGRAKDPDSWEAALQVTDMHTRGARRSLERIAERLTERAEAFMPERFKFGNFTIVDKYGLPYARANAWIEAVTRVGRILQSKGFGYLLYGDLVLAMSNEWDGQYRQNGDLVSLDLGRSSANVQRLVEVLIHELGHRLWFKFLDGGARDQFSTPWIDREQLAREAWENYKQVFTFPASEAEKAFETVWDSTYDLRVFERWLDQDPGRRVRWMQRLRYIYPNYQFTFVEDGKLSPRAFKAAQERIKDLRKELAQSDSPDRKEDVQKQIDRYRERQQKVWTDDSITEMYGVLPTFRDVQSLLEPHGTTYRITDTNETANILREALRIAPPEISVTPYGNTNRQEDFAELFEEVILGKVKDRQHALRLQAVLPRGRVVSATQLRRIGEGFYGPQYRMDVRADEFVHFLPADRADQVVRSGKLLQRPPYQKFGPDKVYAVSTRWGNYRPRVQTTHIQGPVAAILFRTNTRPLLSHPEEVIWDRDVDLIDPRVISKAKAVGLLGRAPLRPADEDFEVVYATVTAAARYWTVKQWLDVQQSGLDRIRDAAQRVDEAFRGDDTGAIETALQQYRADLERWDRHHGYLRPHIQADWRGARFIAVDAVEFQTDKLVPSLPTVIRRGDLDTAKQMWAKRSDRHGDPVDEINKALEEMARNRYLEHESTFGKFKLLDSAGLGFRSDDHLLDAPTLFRALKQVERLFGQKGLGYLLGGIVSVEYRPQAQYGAAYFRRNDRLEVNSAAVISPDRLTRMLVHELGHRVWFRFLSSAQRDRFAANWIETGEDPEEPQTRLPSVTPYGTTNRHEDFAETFAEVVMGTQKGRKLGLKLQGVLPRGRVVSHVVATTMSRAQAFELFKQAVRKVWTNGDELIRRAEFQLGGQPDSKVLAAVMFPRNARIRAIDNTVVRFAPTYELRVSDRLLEKPKPYIEGIMVHEAIHVGYPRHDADFKKLARRHNAPLTETQAETPGYQVQRKEGSRFKTVRVFEDEQEAIRWGKEQAIQDRQSRWRILSQCHATALPFKVGDEILYGKYKNKKGRIIRFGRNPKGQMTVEIEPIPGDRVCRRWGCGAWAVQILEQ